MIPAAIILFCILGALAVEAWVLHRSRLRIPVRIHVNGTRGKSSVTEYVAAGLRAAGKRPLAKVTGILPTLFLPDGSPQLVKRRGPARVQEQARMLRHAARVKADALVLECMSITPEFQRLESRVLRPSIYVITNIRDDHKEVMGGTVAEHAEAICSAIPAHAHVVTAEVEHLTTIEKHARRKNATVHIVHEDHSVPAKEDAVRTLRINVALAAKVCDLAGCPHDVAVAGIQEYAATKKDDSVVVRMLNREVRFINGFAVNDPPSAESFIDHWKEQVGGFDSFAVILNTRSDRPLRTKDFVRWLGDHRDVTSVVLTGTHVPYAYRMLKRAGIPEDRIIRWSRLQVRDPLRALAHVVHNETAVIGLGNIAGDGFTIVDALHGVTAGGH